MLKSGERQQPVRGDSYGAPDRVSLKNIAEPR